MILCIAYSTIGIIILLGGKNVKKNYFYFWYLFSLLVAGLKKLQIPHKSL
nr:MAG TPA: hypothetical protein [Caudoviricetes sp.]